MVPFPTPQFRSLERQPHICLVTAAHKPVVYHLYIMILLCIGNRILTNEIWNGGTLTIIKQYTESKTIFSIKWLMVPRPDLLVSFSVGSLKPLDLSWPKITTAKLPWSFNCNIKFGFWKCLFGWTLMTRCITTFLQVHIGTDIFLCAFSFFKTDNFEFIYIARYFNLTLKFVTPILLASLAYTSSYCVFL